MSRSCPDQTATGGSLFQANQAPSAVILLVRCDVRLFDNSDDGFDLWAFASPCHSPR
ncbi:hypothetical protein FRAHR75_850005 [Frankia sp. Hr75.2]|nr:hypothetical protein FRAHR75_850005 [Frankia sp. Hr75.2]